MQTLEGDNRGALASVRLGCRRHLVTKGAGDKSELFVRISLYYYLTESAQELYGSPLQMSTLTT